MNDNATVLTDINALSRNDQEKLVTWMEIKMLWGRILPMVGHDIRFTRKENNTEDKD